MKLGSSRRDQFWMVLVDNTLLVSIVDDDESVRTAVGKMVESFGFRVSVFRSPAEFLGSGRMRDSACLLLDLQMPGMSGLELHNRLTESGHRIPTIFVTAFTDGFRRDQAMRSGAVAYLAKPFDRNDLLACIHAALDSGRLGEQRS
jgi:FixJ family two-component response regulator